MRPKRTCSVEKKVEGTARYLLCRTFIYLRSTYWIIKGRKRHISSTGLIAHIVTGEIQKWKCVRLVHQLKM